MQGPEPFAAHHLRLGDARRRERAGEVARHHGVDGGIDLLNTGDAALGQLDRRQPLGPDQRARLGGGKITRLVKRLLRSPAHSRDLLCHKAGPIVEPRGVVSGLRSARRRQAALRVFER